MAASKNVETAPEAKLSLAELVASVEDSDETISRTHKNSAKKSSPFRGPVLDSWNQRAEGATVGKTKRVVIPNTDEAEKAVVASIRAAADGLDNDPKLGVSIQVVQGEPDGNHAVVKFAAKVKRTNSPRS